MRGIDRGDQLMMKVEDQRSGGNGSLYIFWK